MPHQSDVSPRRDTGQFRSDLEGLRGIAILSVIGFHAGVPGFSGGYIGVDIFFVLSGYLITGLLVREIENTGRVRFVEFYARRTRRLLPAAALVLAVTLVVGWMIYPPYQQQGFTGTAVATASYASNIWFIREATDYLAADTALNPFQHTWSLSVEEQFYVLWPLLLAFTARFGRPELRVKRLAMVMSALALISFAASVWLTGFIQPLAFFSSPTRAWEFAVGGLGALFVGSRPGKSFQAPLLSWAGIAAIGLATVIFDRTTTFPGIAALLPVLGTVAVLVNSRSSNQIDANRLLSMPTLRWFGLISYSWYLWHWPALLFAETVFESSAILVRLSSMVVALVLAWLTFIALEHPIRSSPALARWPRRSLAGAVCVTVASVGLSLGMRASARRAAEMPDQRSFTEAWHDVPRVYEQGCHLGYFTTESPDCIFGDTRAEPAIVLFGDSHAAQWFPPLEQIALDRHWRLFSLTKSACGAAAIERIDPAIGRTYSECTSWRDATLKRIISLRPRLTIVASAGTFVNVQDHGMAGGVTANDWWSGTRQTLMRLSDAGLSTLLIHDTPVPGFDVPACLARAAWNQWLYKNACIFDRTSALNHDAAVAESRAASQLRGVAVADFTASICGSAVCNPSSNGLVVYRDTHHLTGRFTMSLRAVLSDEMDKAIRAGGIAASEP